MRMISLKNCYIIWYIIEFSDISGVPRRVWLMISYTEIVYDIILKIHDIIDDIIYLTISCPIS